MRFFSSSIAPLLLPPMLVAGCTWVDPSECWVNPTGGTGGAGTIPIGNAVGASSGDFGSWPQSGPLDSGGDANPCMTPDSPPRKSEDTKAPPRSDDADFFEGIPPDVLAKATLKSSAFMYYMDGMLSSSTVDLSDPAALAAAFEQAAPEAEREVDAWLATVDAATLSTVVNNPRFECTEKYGCPYSAKCYNKGSWDIDSTVCHVNDCADAKCRLCPHWFPDTLKHLVFTSWCSYVCTKENSRVSPPVVAQGAIGITSWGKKLPDAGLAWCIEL